MGRYRKIDPRFWKDEKVRQLKPVEKLIALYVFTGQSNRIGIFNFSPGEAAEDLGLSRQTFAKGFENVCRSLSLGWDLEARVLYLPTWWKYNPPENANNVIGNLKDLDDVPDSPLIEPFINNLQYLSETLQVTFTQTLAKRSPQGYPKRSPSQEQEQEQKRESANDKPSPARKPKSKDSDPRVKQFIDFYHAEYLNRFGDKYNFTGKDSAQVKRLVRRYDLDRLKELALSFLNSTDPWVRNNGGFTIGVFDSQISKIISTGKATESHPKEMPEL